jgi:hypothetical protein
MNVLPNHPIHKKINLYRLQAIDFHAHAYGFCQPYSKKGTDRETGYEEEKWHWSYMPVSGQLIKQYESKITYSKITGFKGSGTGKVIDVIKNYVLGIAGLVNKGGCELRMGTNDTNYES